MQTRVILYAARHEQPRRPVHIANGITPVSRRAWALAQIAMAVASGDVDRAEHIAGTMTDKDARDKARADIATALAATDPNRAERIGR
ncbi:MAG: hypothetical protein WA709_39315, partial [Stellaceae bacterium]